MSALKTRLNAHFVACAAVAATAAVATSEKADAGIVYSGVVNINIPYTTAGIYLNVVTNVSNIAPASAPGWDVNPFSATTLSFFNPAAPAGGVYVVNFPGGTSATAPDNLPAGTLISAASGFGSGAGEQTGITSFLLSSSNNIVGFRFQNEANGNQTHYGWMRLSLGSAFGSAGGARAIVEYAYEDQAGVGILAGAGVPAPGAFALLGVAGLVGNRRRRVA